ncbi:hypothetical protein ACLD0W_12740 [Alloalcanivorax sp. C16-1]|uniref:hypothetical protein n=1 Tax=Alloalcanivorax sp. C16-1 TaxID=3390051 RepID=UPI0039704B3B
MIVFRALLALSAPAVFFCLLRDLPDERIHAVATAMVGASGTMLGFLITAVSIVAALMDRTLIRNLKKTGHFDQLIQDTFITCAALLFALILGLVSLFLDGCVLGYTAMGLFFFICFGIIYLWEAGRRFKNIIISL